MSVRIPTFEEILAVSHSRGGMSYAPGLWDGLVGAWPLQEGGGVTAFDASGYGRHGTLTNMDPATDWVVGEKGRALDFDATNDYVTLNKVFPITGNFSLAAWVKFGNVTADHAILSSFSGADGAAGQWMFWFDDAVGVWSNSPDKMSFIWYTGASASNSHWTSSGTVLAANTWYHVAVSLRSGVESRVYLNGVDDTGFQQFQTQTTGTKSVIDTRIGENFDGNRRFLGSIFDAFIWNRALMPAEIQQLYADPWAMYRQRRRVFAATVAPSAGKPTHFMYYQRLRRAG